MFEPVVQFHETGGIRIYRIPMRAFHRFVAYGYVVIAGDYAALIDTGSGREQSNADLEEGFAALRTEWGETLEWADLRRIVITHGHPDHYGGLSYVQARSTAPVAVHTLDARMVERPREAMALFTQLGIQYLQRAGADPAEFPGMFHRYTSQGVPEIGGTVSTILHGGERLDGLFDVYHTPGHAAGQVCLRLGDTLFCADHLLARTNPRLLPEGMVPSNGLVHYLAALDTIAALPNLKLALAGHEEPIHDVGARIHAIRAAHTARLEQMLALCDEPRTVSEIATLVYPELRGLDQRLLAIEATGARIEYLDQHGMLALANVDELIENPLQAPRYQRTRPPGTAAGG